MGKLRAWSCSPHDPKPGFMTLRLRTRWTTANVRLTPEHARVLVNLLERTAATVEPAQAGGGRDDDAGVTSRNDDPTGLAS